MTTAEAALELDFRQVSAELGRDATHVQGPGGNTSLKLGAELMWVKASGFLLEDAMDKEMFARVAFTRVRSALEAGAQDPLLGSFDVAGLRPSIEASLHALMPHRAVLHTHSIPVLAAACRADAAAFLERSLAGLGWAFVEYARPGTPLAQAARRALAKTRDAAVLVLQNHGVVVGADTPRAAQQLLAEVCQRLPAQTRVPESAADLELLEALASAHGLALPGDPQVHGLALHPLHTQLAQLGTLYPDHVVFLGPKVSILSEFGVPGADAVAQAASKLWLVPGKGALLAPGLPSAALALARCLADLVARLPEPSACRYLSARDEAELLGMEEEKYRQALARGRV